jgi:hypothetical protein
MTIKPLLALAGLLLFLSPATADFIAGRDLFLNEVPNGPQELLNPNFTVPAWSYGYRTTVASSSLTLLQPAHHTNALNGNAAVQGYGSNVDETVDVAVNTGNTPVVYDHGAGPLLPLQPLEMTLHPSQANEFPVMRWTAPATGTYQIEAYWRDLDTHGGDGVSAHVVVNGVSVFGQDLDNGGSTATSHLLALLAGDHVDFVVGSRGGIGFDTTAFDASIATSGTSGSAVPEPSSWLLLLTGTVAGGVLFLRRHRHKLRVCPESQNLPCFSGVQGPKTRLSGQPLR